MSSVLSARQRRIEVVRWLIVLPAAVVAGLAVQLIISALVRGLSLGGSAPPDSASIDDWARAVPSYFLPMFVFVVTGGRFAPRKRLVVAFLLMVLGGVLSLLNHVVGQSLAGNRVGFVNYGHFGLETAGLVAGFLYTRWKFVTAPSGDQRP